MADSYEIIDGQVVPYYGGRKGRDTDAWRDATPLEIQMQSQLVDAESAIDALRAEVERLQWQLYGEINGKQLVEAEAEAKQARIDELMLEYCPEEMTQEQVENWKRHQVRAIDAARKGAE